MSIIDFYKNYYDEFKRNGFEWLWFLFVLYVVAVFNYPHLKLYQQIKRDGTGINLKRDWHLLLMQTILLIIFYFIIIWYNEVPYVLFLVGYLLPLILEIILVIYFDFMVSSGLLVLKHVLLPCTTILLAALMSPDAYDVLDDGNKQYICMLLFYHTFYIKGYGDQHTNDAWAVY